MLSPASLLQSIAAADRMIHYVFCGDRFVNPDGEGIVKVCCCRSSSSSGEQEAHPVSRRHSHTSFATAAFNMPEVTIADVSPVTA